VELLHAFLSLCWQVAINSILLLKMSQLGEELNESAVSKIIFDAATCKRYTRGRFLGKVCIMST